MNQTEVAEERGQLTNTLAEFAVSARPARVVLEKTGTQFIDTIACMVVGSQHPLIGPVRSSLSWWGAGGDAYSLCLRETLPLLQSIAVDAAGTRLWDLDDVHDETGDHPSVSTIPPALVVGQRVENTIEDVLSAVAVAQELQIRVRLGSSERLGTQAGSHPWTTGTYAPLGAAIVSSRLLDGSANHMRQSLGNAFTYMSNTAESQREGGNTHLLHQGVAVALGVQSALAASQGIGGIMEPLEGPLGYYRAYHRTALPDTQVLHDLGDRYHLLEVSQKRYPACRHSHGVLDALHLARSQPWFPQVEGVSIGIGESALSILHLGEAIPTSPAESAFHLPYLASVMLTTGEVTTTSLQGVSGDVQVAIQMWMNRIEVHRDDELTYEQQRSAGANISFLLTNGEVITGFHSPQQVNRDGVEAKFINAWTEVGLIESEATALLREINAALAESRTMVSDITNALTARSEKAITTSNS